MKLKQNLRKGYHLVKYYGFSKLIYSAGMPRSGSTLMFNMIKEILLTKYTDNDLGYGWVEEANEMQKKYIYLIKTHGLHRLDALRAQRIFYTYRDLRDVMVSRLRKFDKEPTIGIVRYYVQQYEFAKKHADLCLKYEDMIQDLPGTVASITGKLDLEVAPENIIQNLPDVNKTQINEQWHDQSTLLHKDHVTHTRQGEWQTVLPEAFQKQLMDEFSWWFQENNYDIS